ncbi:hypothetical protein ACSXAY_16950 (plasmid) [Clostridium perfringens]
MDATLLRKNSFFIVYDSKSEIKKVDWSVNKLIINEVVSIRNNDLTCNLLQI